MVMASVQAFLLGATIGSPLSLKLTPTNSMEQRPSCEANSSSATQKIPRILWKPEVHYRIQKSPPPVLIQSHIDSVRTPIPFPQDKF